MAARANVILPSGKTADIDPKNWPELRRRAAADKRYGGAMPKFASKEDAELVVETLTAEPDDATTTAQDFVRGVRRGATAGFADEGAAAVGAGIAAAKGEDFAENYERLRDYERAENKRSDDRSPVVGGAGKVAGALPGTVASLIGAAPAAGVGVGRALTPLAGTAMQEVGKRAAPYAGAAALGGLAALGESEATKQKGSVSQDILEGAGGGIVGQGVGSVVANPLVRLATAPKGAVAEGVKKLARKVPEKGLDFLDALLSPKATAAKASEWVRSQKQALSTPSSKSQLPENTGSLTAPDKTDPLASPKERAKLTEQETLDAIARGRAESRAPENTDPNHPRIPPLADATKSGTLSGSSTEAGTPTAREVPRAKGRPTSAADRRRAVKELRRAAVDDPDRTASITPTPTGKGPRERGVPPETTSPDRLAKGSEEPAFKTVPRDAELERVEKQPGFKPAGREERELPGVRRDKYDPKEPRPVKTDYRKYAEEKHAKIDAFDKITDENARKGEVLPTAKPADPLGELTSPPRSVKPRGPKANKELETLLTEALELVPAAQRDAFAQYARGLPPKQAIAQMKEAIAKTRAQRGLPPSTKEPKTPPEEPDPARKDPLAALERAPKPRGDALLKALGQQERSAMASAKGNAARTASASAAIEKLQEDVANLRVSENPFNDAPYGPKDAEALIAIAKRAQRELTTEGVQGAHAIDVDHELAMAIHEATNTATDYGNVGAFDRAREALMRGIAGLREGKAPIRTTSEPPTSIPIAKAEANYRRRTAKRAEDDAVHAEELEERYVRKPAEEKRLRETTENARTARDGGEGRRAMEELRAADDESRPTSRTSDGVQYSGPHTMVRESWEAGIKKYIKEGMTEEAAYAKAWRDGGLRSWVARSGSGKMKPKEERPGADVVDLKVPAKKSAPGAKPDALSELERPPAKVLDAKERFPDESSQALMARAKEVDDNGKPTERAISAWTRLQYLRGFESEAGVRGPFKPSEDAHDLTRRWSDQDANAWVQKAQKASPDDVAEMQAALDAGDEGPMPKWIQLSDSDPQGAAWKLLTSGWRFEKGRWVHKKK